MMIIDPHTHILPNIDDGAVSVAEALNMIESLSKQNVQKAVCTPHFDPTKMALQDFISKRSAAMALIKDSKITLISGSETLLHDYLFHYSDLSLLCIESTKYLLLELPYSKKWDDNVFDMIKKLIEYYNLIPIIAHIERYPMVKKHDKYIKKLIEMGCVIQLNTSSILEKNCSRRALRYIKNGLIDILASDCHNMIQRPPNIEVAFDLVIHKLGDKCLDKLKYNAECIINGIELREKDVYIIK